MCRQNGMFRSGSSRAMTLVQTNLPRVTSRRPARRSRIATHVLLVASGAAVVVILAFVPSSAFLPMITNDSASTKHRKASSQPQGDAREAWKMLSLNVGTIAWLQQTAAATAAGAVSQGVEKSPDVITPAASQLPVLVAGGVAVLGALALALPGGGDEKKGNVDDKSEVKDYFNSEGFQRWSKIYGDTDEVNPVQKDIRVGHAETVSKILKWVDGDGISGKTVCDAGCGTGLLSIPLAARGAVVSGSDISSAMAGEAAKRADVALKDVPNAKQPVFSTCDLEALSGQYDVVTCVDVLIHYPPEKLNSMVSSLTKLTTDRLIFSFAPKTWYYVALKRIGELFPGKSKTTRAYLHEEENVEAALKAAGFAVTRREMTGTNFYFSRLFEAKRADKVLSQSPENAVAA